VRLQRLVLAVAVAGVLAAGAFAATSKPRTLPTATPVSGLATSGSTVAVATAWSASHCERMLAWNPVRPTLRAIGKGGRCDETSTGRGIVGQAIAGTRVAWIADGGGNSHDAVLSTASLLKPGATHRLLVATRDVDSGAGNWVGALQGGGSLLVYATWSVCDTGEPASHPCPAGVAPGTIYNSKLWRIDSLTTRKLIASTPDALFPVGVAAGRILVARGNGTSFELRGADGHVIQTYTPDAEALQASLGPKELVLAVRPPLNPPLTKARLQFVVYNLATGAVERTLAVPVSALTVAEPRCTYPLNGPAVACSAPLARLRFSNADATRFVYVLDTAVHVARLDGSKDATLTPAGQAPVFAALAGSGLVYSYRTGGGVQGRVQYLPSP
jgi:hypothetical protein